MIPRTRVLRRFLPWTGAAMALAFVLAPNGAKARTYTTNGPPYAEGDPTADDQPSPTPKPTRSLSRAGAIQTSQVAGASAASDVRFIWLSYVRAWIRISLR